MPRKKKTDPKDEPIINKEALKAKSEEVVKNVKEGVEEAADNFKEGATELAGNVKEVSADFAKRVKGDPGLIIACCVCAFVVLVIIIALFSAIFGNKSKGTVKDFSKAVVKLDEKKYCKAINKDIMEEEYGGLLECEEEVEAIFTDVEEQYKDYEIKSYKVLKQEEVEDIADKLEDKYSIEPQKVKKVYRYKVKYDALGTKNDKIVYVFAAKINGKWRVISAGANKDAKYFVVNVDPSKLVN